MIPKEAIRRIKQYNVVHSRKEKHFAVHITEALNMAVDALEKKIPKKPYSDNDNGIYEKECCPNCHRSLFPNDHHCRCGQSLDWSDI